MPSKLVVAHEKLTGEITAAYRTHGPALVEAVHTVTRAKHPASKVDVKPLLDHALSASTEALDTLLARDAEYQIELGDDAAPRQARDVAAAELYAVLVQLKASTASLFGATWVTKLTFPNVVPSDPAHVKRAAEQVLHALETHRLPPPQIPGVARIDAKAWKDSLQTPLTALEKALTAVKTEENEALAARAKRDAALTALIAANVDAAQLALVLARIGRVAHLVEGLRGTLDTNTGGASDEDAPVDPPVNRPVG